MTHRYSLYGRMIRSTLYASALTTPSKSSVIQSCSVISLTYEIMVSFGLSVSSVPAGRTGIFAISDNEFDEILRLYLKVNDVTVDPQQIREPYRHVEPNLRSRLSFDSSAQPKYEATVSALFLDALSRGRYSQLFGAYSDYLAYVPTSFQKEIDALLVHPFPGNDRDVVAYTLIEIKRERFTEDGLSQLLRYEDWFLKKRVGGDSRAIRTVAIARTFDDRVLNYLSQRSRLEGKTVRLLRYNLTADDLILDAVQLP